MPCFFMTTVRFLLLTDTSEHGPYQESEPTVMIEDLLISEGYSVKRGSLFDHLDEDLEASDVVMVEVREPSSLARCNDVRLRSHQPMIIYGVEVPLTTWIKGLNSGSDLYISLPANGPVLRAQIRSLLRRSGLMHNGLSNLSS